MNIRENEKLIIFAFSIFLILIFVSSTNCSNSCFQRVSYNLNENSEILVQAHKIRISILEFDEIYVSETFVIENKGSEPIFSIRIWLNRTIENIEIVDTNGDMDFVQTVYGEGIACDIDFRTVISTGHIASFDVKYNLVRNTRLEENLNIFYFIFDPLLSYSTQELVISLTLPENFDIHVFEDNDTLSYPVPAEILELEPSITLQWIFLNQDINSKNEIFIFFEEDITFAFPIWLIFVIAICGIGTGGLTTYLIMRRKGEIKMKILSETYLTEDQKIIIKSLQEKDGKMTQKELVLSTGHSKSKVSRDITLLEKNNFVRRQRWGRQYRVYLTDLGNECLKEM
ncbi:MAG: helix-turn-helix transcriptional regulator [Candidatus Heimdallarchaeaceae archaeon]